MTAHEGYINGNQPKEYSLDWWDDMYRQLIDLQWGWGHEPLNPEQVCFLSYCLHREVNKIKDSIFPRASKYLQDIINGNNNKLPGSYCDLGHRLGLLDPTRRNFDDNRLYNYNDRYCKGNYGKRLICPHVITQSGIYFAADDLKIVGPYANMEAPLEIVGQDIAQFETLSKIQPFAVITRTPDWPGDRTPGLYSWETFEYPPLFRTIYLFRDGQLQDFIDIRSIGTVTASCTQQGLAEELINIETFHPEIRNFLCQDLPGEDLLDVMQLPAAISDIERASSSFLSEEDRFLIDAMKS